MGRARKKDKFDAVKLKLDERGFLWTLLFWGEGRGVKRRVCCMTGWGRRRLAGKK
jgi:hypothetical protein